MKKAVFYFSFVIIILSCNDVSKPDDISSQPLKETSNNNTSLPPASSNSNDNTEQGTTPIDDQTHIEAAVMAKEFVVKKFNTSPPPSFDDSSLDWLKLKHGVYKISSVVVADNADCIKCSYDWVVKLKYKSGDWADIKNWNLIDIKITKKN